jgi:hypothetical protein
MLRGGFMDAMLTAADIARPPLKHAGVTGRFFA